MTSRQDRFPVAASRFRFARTARAGPRSASCCRHTAEVADELCFIKSMHTEAINHDPAITFFQTGAQLAGRPSIGSWLAYGLGSENRDLPAFVVLVSQGTGNPNDQPLYDRLWGSGFLPTKYQGDQVPLRRATRCSSCPIPPGLDAAGAAADARRPGEAQRAASTARWAIPRSSRASPSTRWPSRMQTSVPELTDLSSEPESVFELYGPEARKPGTYAANCLLARRLAERGVRFIQLFHRGWDQHVHLPRQIAASAATPTRPRPRSITDLKQRGLLDDTLVVWGGEFGRTVYCQGTLTADDYGRDHHPRCFTVWLAGGGIKPGMTHGETDDFGYNIARDPVHVHDLHATMLHCLGIDHTRLTFKFQGRHYRLTDVHGKVVKAVLA